MYNIYIIYGRLRRTNTLLSPQYYIIHAGIYSIYRYIQTMHIITRVPWPGNTNAIPSIDIITFYIIYIYLWKISTLWIFIYSYIVRISLFIINTIHIFIYLYLGIRFTVPESKCIPYKLHNIHRYIGIISRCIYIPESRFPEWINTFFYCSE